MSNWAYSWISLLIFYVVSKERLELIKVSEMSKWKYQESIDVSEESPSGG